MKKCPNCKEQVQDSAKFCVHCGFNIKEHEEKNKNKHCPECGFKLSPNTKFCPECGTKIEFNINENKVLDDDPLKLDSFNFNFDFDDSFSKLDNMISEKNISSELKFYDYEMYDETGIIIKKYKDIINTSVVLPKNVVMIDKNAFENTLITDIKFNDKLSFIGERAFANCKYLSKVVMTPNVRVIENEAFMNCPKLKLVIPPTVSVLGDDIFGINKVKEEKENKIVKEEKKNEYKINVNDLPNEAKKFIDDIYEEFDTDFEIKNNVLVKYHGNKDSIIIPNNVKVIGEYAFEDNIKLKTVTFSDSVEVVQKYSFKGCSNITYVLLGKKTKELGEKAFADCTNLRRIHIPESLKKIGEGCFYKCKSLVEVNINVDTIPKEAFCDCESLQDIKLGASVRILGDYCLKNTKLYELTIPKSVKEIGFEAISSRFLQEVHLEGIIENFELLAIRGSDTLDVYLYCNSDEFKNKSTIYLSCLNSSCYLHFFDKRDIKFIDYYNEVYKK
jgi:hypothetical protein